MLVLTRRVGESLIVGKDDEIINGLVILTVLSVKGNQVRIGLQAAKEVPVHRQEIFNRIQDERQLNKNGV